MRRRPVFSIITPTFNNGRFVNRCYWSLSQQLEDDWEWIVVDDASTDGTQEILAALKDPRIVIHRFG